MSYPQNPQTAFAIHPPVRRQAGAPPLFLVVDLFCGFGGVTRGFSLAQLNGWFFAKVIACVNHDENAIASHLANHPEVEHFREDIRKLNLTELRDIVRRWQQLYPDAYLILWASPDCTHHSRAKGGESRNADSRTLARHLRRYVKILNPDYIMVENVTDFRSWGPLIIKTERHRVATAGRSVIAESCPLKVDKETGELGPIWIPEKRTKARDFLRWIESLKRCGYQYDDRDLNAADFGAYTSRLRYYGIFAKKGLPIRFPSPTHAKKPGAAGLFETRKPWNAVREKLDLTDQGESIFGRKDPVCENSLERVYAGLVKFVAGGSEAFLQQYFSGNPTSKVQSLESPCPTITTKDHNGAVFITKYRGHSKNRFSATANSADAPCPTVTTMNHLGIVSAEFLVQRNGGDASGRVQSVETASRTLTTTGGNLGLVQAEFLMQSNGGVPTSKVYSTDTPGQVITTADNQQLVQAEFLTNYNGTAHSLNLPGGTITTKDRFALVQSEFFIDKQYGSGKHNHQSLDVPAGTLTQVPKLNLVEAQFLADQRFSNTGLSIDQPGPTLLTGNHFYLVTTEAGEAAIVLFPDDSPALRRIKLFMAAYGIIDIRMRMLRIKELLRIQGFPDDYLMVGTQEEHKKFIGNSVEPTQVVALAVGLAEPLLEYLERRLAA